MSRKKINNSMIPISVAVLLYCAGCSQRVESPISEELVPVLDFVAVADIEEETSDLGEVLLRLQLLHTRTDILKYGINSPEEHQQRLSYYRTHFKEDIFLVSDTDTIPCHDVHAERLYMDLPYMNFILTFNRRLANGDKLLINDVIYSQHTVILDIDLKMQTQ